MADWNNDSRKDVVVGSLDGKIRLYLNEGTDAAPDFLTEAYVQEGGTDLAVPSSRSSPFVLDLDGDGNKDLLTGNTNGEVLFYGNTGTDADPAFSGYSCNSQYPVVSSIVSVFFSPGHSINFHCNVALCSSF